MKAILIDKNEEGEEVRQELTIGDHAPRDFVQDRRITGEGEPGKQYIYRLQGIDKNRVATYRYNGFRSKPSGFVPSPRRSAQ